MDKISFLQLLRFVIQLQPSVPRLYCHYTGDYADDRRNVSLTVRYTHLIEQSATSIRTDPGPALDLSRSRSPCPTVVRTMRRATIRDAGLIHQSSVANIAGNTTRINNALTNGDKTNRIHFFLNSSQTNAQSRLRLSFELLGGGFWFNLLNQFYAT